MLNQKLEIWRDRFSETSYYRWIVLVSVTLGAFMMNLDSSIVSVALPVWAEKFHASPAILQWIMVAYLAVITSIIPTMGGLADKFGHKLFYISGIAIFTLGSILCALGNSIQELILFRTFQAVGASMVMSNVIAITSLIFPPGERGRALGINGSFVAAGTIMGPAAGSFILSVWDWRGIFWINVPVGLLVLVMAGVLLKPLKSKKTGGSFDIPGAIYFFITSSALVLYLSNGPVWGWGSKWSWLSLGVGVVFLVIFVVREFQAPNPLINPAFFRVLPFTFGLSCTYIYFLLMLLASFILPLYLNEVGVPITQMGWLLIAQPVVMLVSSPLSGWIADKFSRDGTAAMGMAMLAVGMYLLSNLGTQPSYVNILFALAIFGLGLGLFSSANNVSVLESLPQNRSGIVGALLSTVRNMGRVSGVSFATILLYLGMSFVGAQSARPIASASLFVFLAGMVFALIGLALTLSRIYVNRSVKTGKGQLVKQ